MQFVEPVIRVLHVRCSFRVERAENRLFSESNVLPDSIVRELADVALSKVRIAPPTLGEPEIEGALVLIRVDESFLSERIVRFPASESSSSHA
ncbi:hypothetical protein ACFQPA_10245 [Halomarina halobia]|uniref:Uncharacterized protein n=1 Tax=Halomarina halobia TaxID=3033386 RepID=A0ABD6ABC2_9EURY|nr:hypothetical protein [Halomarina sp. PSR21]